jgi:CRISPR-associated endonuclease/helicase Cas3
LERVGPVMVEELRTVWAHSANESDRRHALVDHLRETARLARLFAVPFGGGQIAWWLGLLHDAGKASCAWQDGLARAEAHGGRVGLDHKSLGAQLALGRRLGKFALAIEGHHGGLGTPEALSHRLADLDVAVRERNVDAERTLRRLLPELASDEAITLPAAWREDRLVAELALRLVFSALCDADRLDTAAHGADAPAPAVRPDADWSVLRDRFEKRRAELLAERSPSPIDSIRAEVYQACLAAAAAGPGVFRLAAPTGAGKTLASAGFALHHAVAHGLRRVVVAVPFLTITEQNAAVYRRLLDGEDPEDGGRVVLEHHSGVDLDSDLPGRRWDKLAAENWDAPFVVTTSVRLFEALFDRKPSAMRRLHRLAGAVVVLDEVQALPHDMLVPILDVLRKLVDHFGTTVLLASATQPDFWHLSPFRALQAHEIVSEPASLVERLRRVRFEWRIDPSPTLEQVADEVADVAANGSQAMVVVNTTADAWRVFDRWRGLLPADVAWHLSTRMCPAHRRQVLTRIQQRLLEDVPILLVSTQLIEAGVDIDFPVVYRVLAPADSLLQAAGRANREGHLGGAGRVVIVDPPDAGSPPSYKHLVNATRVHFGPGKADPDDLRALHAYYRSIYGARNLEDPRHVGQRIQAARRAFDFPAVREGPLTDAAKRTRDPGYAFRMIKDEGIAVVTPYGTDSLEAQQVRDLAERIRTSPRPDMDALRELQPYTTTVHPSALRAPGVMALLRPVIGEVGAAGSLAEWTGTYDSDTGIELDPRIEEFVQ